MKVYSKAMRLKFKLSILFIIGLSTLFIIVSGCDYSDTRDYKTTILSPKTSFCGQIKIPSFEDRKIISLYQPETELKIEISGENLLEKIIISTNSEGKFKIQNINPGNYFAEFQTIKNSGKKMHLGELTFTLFPEENNCMIITFQGFDTTDSDKDKRADEMILHAIFFTDNNEDFLPDNEYFRTVNQDRSSQTTFNKNHYISHRSDGTSLITKNGVQYIINDRDDDTIPDDKDTDDDNDGIPDSQDKDHFNNGIIDTYEESLPLNSSPEFTLINLKGNQGLIKFEFYLTDIEQSVSYLKIDFRGGSRGSIWTIASVTGEITNIVTDNNLKIAYWDSSADQSGMIDNNYQLRFTPYNLKNNLPGPSVVSQKFTIDNSNANNPPNVKITIPNGGEVISGLKTITWTASDSDPDDFIQTTELFYSLEKGDWINFKTISGNPGYFNWDTTNLINSSKYLIKITCFDGKEHSHDISDNFFAVSNAGKNMFPRISNININGSTGDIIINYDLLDQENDLCSIRIEYKGGIAGSQWTPASIQGKIDKISPGGGLSIIWQSKIDEPLIYSEDYIIRITPIDGNAWGLFSESAPFKIDNRNK
jgi:hypothetical protein